MSMATDFHRTAIKLIIALSAIIVLGTSAFADFVFLRDGSIIQGTVVNDGKTAITVRDLTNKVQVIQREMIIRILFTELKMSKVYVQKRDGEGIVAYLVDEDRTSYTFRMDLYKPVEFKLDRSEVLFISEKNPSGLKGEAEYDTISLKWLPPYDQVKEYRVYIKKKKEDKYELAGKTGRKEMTLEKLDSNSNYLIIVTSVDTADYESTPSNELKIATKNRPPVKIANAKIITNPSGDAVVVFDETTDTDGKIIAYRLYRQRKGIRILLSESKSPSFTLRDFERGDRYTVAAVDDLKVESDLTRVAVEGGISDHALEISPAVALPVGKFSKMARIGYGGVVRYKNTGVLMPNMTLIAETGFIYFKGKSFNAKDDFVSIAMIPLMAGVTYDFQPRWNITISPEFDAGFVIFNAAYHANEPSTGATNRMLSHKLIIDVGVRAGIGVSYSFTESLYMTAGPYFGYIREADGNLFYAQGILGMGYRF